MGTFSIWHWAIVLLIIGVSVFFAVRSAVKPSQGPAALIGFGGWLMLLAIGQVLPPLRTLADLANSAEGYRQLMSLPNGLVAVYSEVALNLAFLALQLVVLISMLRRSRRFPQLFLFQWIAIPVVLVLDTILISSTLGVPVSQIFAGDALMTPVLSFILTGAWVAYVYKSVRVKNMFCGEVAAGQVATAA
ncbi:MULTISPECIES: DUF2569 family protein [unclassified Mesorhizobium]|uniref:DUF2569 family protein n=1 Tax=unclassified Mesorhizobium TaxID=325217 RepID=UPI001128311E|nr:MULTISPECIES: DUF2569 family protein [unclassified Mesorhizobium]TPJ54935.1 DUF2569 family protein [Mesorhizobium sp. B2-6-4]TPM93119.1 DUF2569 family protein [Mesorhizobium sp. B2-1-5]